MFTVEMGFCGLPPEFLLDEYQACSGERMQERKITAWEEVFPQGLKPSIIFQPFSARDPEGTPVVPCYKTWRCLLV
jgi:hypothetical protein